MHCHQLYHMTVGMFLELHYQGFAKPKSPYFHRNTFARLRG